MTLQFPNNPSINQQFTASNNLIYRYDGQKWITLGTAAVTDGYVVKSGDTMTGDLTVPSLNGGQLAGFRNQLINGDLRIWQRGSTGSGSYIADRWRTSGAVGNTYERVSSNADLAAVGFQAGLKNDGPAGTIFGQYIELDRQGKACQFPVGSEWTWSIWSTTAPTNTLIRWSKNDNTTSEEAATPGAWTVIATQGAFNRYQQTFTIANDPVDSGISALLVRFNIASKQIVSGCQLEPGPVATPFEHRPVGLELSLCQRYFVKQDFGTSSTAKSVAYSTGNFTTQLPYLYYFPVEMRAQPTVDFTGLVVKTGTTVRTPTLNLTETPVMRYIGASDLPQNTTGNLSVGGVLLINAEL